MGLRCRLGVGVCEGVAAGGAASWVMIVLGILVIFMGDATTATAGHATISHQVLLPQI